MCVALAELIEVLRADPNEDLLGGFGLGVRSHRVEYSQGVFEEVVTDVGGTSERVSTDGGGCRVGQMLTDMEQCGDPDDRSG